MSGERQLQVERICQSALDLEGTARRRFLDSACEGDPALRRDVESLLAHEQTAEGFIQAPALEHVARALAKSATLGPGDRIGPYEVTSVLGSGGMGEVYRARDKKLRRDVAVKVLPQLFLSDPARRARFEREARTLAALNHPHIAAIYGTDESGGVPALVLELLEGDTLDSVLARSPRRRLPPQKALPIVRQIAEALESAHDKGIVHLDLKPSNVMVTADGRVKVLDFGLASALGDHDGEDGGTPAVATGSQGLIVGSPAYMSPEQAQGQPTDRRTDVWAFGCVLFEMLSGKRAFTGDTASATLEQVLTTDPDWTALPEPLAPSIARLLRRCLQKDRRQRLADIADARLEIDEAANQRVETTRSPAWSLRSVALGALVVAGLTGLGYYIGGAFDEVAERRVEVNVPPTTSFGSFAISPDGRTLVFVATSDGLRRLWLRPLDSVDARPLRGTEGANLPFWSPTSQSIGFFADGKLKRIDINGGSLQTLTNAPVAIGGSWNQDGVILFAPGPGAPLFRVLERGGEATAATRLDPRQVSHNQPCFLPDNEHFLFFAEGGEDVSGVYLGSLSSPEIRRLFAADAPAVFVPPSQIAFIQQGTLFTRRLDTRSNEPRGDAVPVAQRVGAVSAAGTGVIAYRATPLREELPQLNWLDRTGAPVARLGALQSLSPELSPDGAFVAMHRQVGGNVDVWLVDATTGGAPIRFTTGPAVEGFPIWSPDGTRIVFRSSRVELRVKAANASRTDEVFWKSSKVVLPLDWSPDGRHILLRQHETDDPHGDVLALSIGANGTPEGVPFAVANSKFDERDVRFSPDGRWVAYQSNESGRFEIYLQPFPGPGSRIPVSTNGGVQVRWPRRQFEELFYIGLDGKLMVVPVTMSTAGAIKTGAPSVLFPTNVRAATNRDQLRQEFDVSPDGRRVLMSEVVEWTTPISLILD